MKDVAQIDRWNDGWFKTAMFCFFFCYFGSEATLSLQNCLYFTIASVFIAGKGWSRNHRDTCKEYRSQVKVLGS